MYSSDVSTPAPTPKIAESKIISLDEANILESEIEDWISEHPDVLGLGDITVVKRQRAQEPGGRLDLLLADYDHDRRFEVELMRGSLDPSHLVRSIEYWDIERRLYPAYDHCAVIVAEDITTRFLNVIQLFSGSIPMIAMQVNCIKVGDAITLNFIKVLDSRQLREDETSSDAEGPTTPDYWEKRVGVGILSIAEESLKVINKFATRSRSLKFNKGYIGLTENGQPNNCVYFIPKKAFMRIGFRLESPDPWLARLGEVGLEPVPSPNGIRVKLTKLSFAQNQALISELFEQAVKDDES
jgi:hypothetical protein